MELRTVLTAEVAERHDQLVALRDKLKEEEQRHHETKMQLQLKTEVVKDLRKEVRECKERPLANIGKVNKWRFPGYRLVSFSLRVTACFKLIFYISALS